MEQEDKRLETAIGDLILDTFVTTHGPTPEMRKYATNKSEWAIALGRLQLAREEVERLEKIEKAIRLRQNLNQ